MKDMTDMTEEELNQLVDGTRMEMELHRNDEGGLNARVHIQGNVMAQLSLMAEAVRMIAKNTGVEPIDVAAQIWMMSKKEVECRERRTVSMNPEILKAWREHDAGQL